MAKPNGNSQRIATSDGDRLYRNQKDAIESAQKAIRADLARMAEFAGYKLSPDQEEKIIESVDLYWRMWCHEQMSNSGADVRKKISEAKRNLYALFEFIDRRVDTKDSRRSRGGPPGKVGRRALKEPDKGLLECKLKRWQRRCELLSKRRFSPARAANMLSNVTWLALVCLDKCEVRMFEQNRQTLRAGKGWHLWILLLEAIVRENGQKFVANPRATKKKHKAMLFVQELHRKLPSELTANATNLPEDLRRALASRTEFASSRTEKVPVSYADWKKEMRRFINPTRSRWGLPSKA
ncbi:MAG: hypothetical protein J0H17_15245 [Rhizobiales bacterium]|nr:hypothetical protein [Hyphomicrobiales bacterium]